MAGATAAGVARTAAVVAAAAAAWMVSAKTIDQKRNANDKSLS